MEKSALCCFNAFTYDRIEFNFFAKDVKYICFIEYLHFNAQQHLYRGFFFENMRFPNCLKIEKSMIFFEFLFMSSYCFLRVKSCVEHVFADFRAIRCRKRTFFDDLE